MADPLALDKVVDAVLECMCSALTAAAEALEGQPGCPCVSCKSPGTPTWICDGAGSAESGCAGGQLDVSVNRIFPSTTFPSQDLGADGCAPSTIVAEISVLILRCMPLVSDQGDDDCLPTCEQLAAAARILHVDMLTVFRAATCCVTLQDLPAARRKRRVAISSHRAIGPLERCVGSELVLLVDVGNPCGCDELPTPDPSV